MSSKVLSMRIPESQEERLRQMARRLGHSPAETGALLIEEGLRRSEFGFIDFRNTSAGRQAFIQNSRLPVWMVVKVIRSYRGNLEKAARHLARPQVQLRAAMKYAQAFRDEIEAAIEESDTFTSEKLSRMLPQTEVFKVQ
jgi:hypothetical protein